MQKGVVEKCWREVLCCRRVLWRSAGEERCNVEKCWREVLC